MVELSIFPFIINNQISEKKEWIERRLQAEFKTHDISLLRVVVIRRNKELETEEEFEKYCIWLPKIIAGFLSDFNNLFIGFYGLNNCCSMLTCLQSKKKLERILERLSCYLNKQGFSDFYFGVGKPVFSYLDVKDSLDSLNNYVLNEFVDLEHPVVFAEDVAIDHTSLSYKSFDFDAIITAFKNGDIELIKRISETAAEKIKIMTPASENAPYPTSIRRFFIELTVYVLHIASDFGVDVDTVLEKQDPYSIIMNLPSTPRIISWFIDVCTLMHHEIEIKESKSGQTVVEKICHIISEELGNKALCLDYVSSLINLSSSYLCTIFRKEMNIGFNEYIQKKRMELSLEYIENTTIRISEVAFLTGFSSPNYFNRAFKKYYGKTPSEKRAEKKPTFSK